MDDCQVPMMCRCVPVSPGTGASCIYPLLGATMNGWYFLATEVDDICFDYAKKNVEQNNMSDLIKGESALEHWLLFSPECLFVPPPS